MSSGITTFTALKLEDKDVNDPNSGFYTTQATQEQIDAIPADAKAEGELIYNTTTGNLMVFSKGIWNTLNSAPGSDGNIVINKYPTAPAEPTEGEIYYDTSKGELQIYISGSWQDVETKPYISIRKDNINSLAIDDLLTFTETDSVTQLRLPASATTSVLGSKFFTVNGIQSSGGFEIIYAGTYSTLVSMNVNCIVIDPSRAVLVRFDVKCTRSSDNSAYKGVYATRTLYPLSHSTNKIEYLANIVITDSFILDPQDKIEIYISLQDGENGTTPCSLYIGDYSIQITGI